MRTKTSTCTKIRRGDSRAEHRSPALRAYTTAIIRGVQQRLNDRDHSGYGACTRSQLGAICFFVNCANDQFVNAYTEADCACAAWQCASNCDCKDFWYSSRFGRWLEPWARKDTAGQAGQADSTGTCES